MITVLFACFAIGLLVGIPIVVTLMLATLAPGLVNPEFAGNTQFVLRAIVGGGDNTAILAAPLFVLSGVIMAKGGISEKIFNVFAYLFGRVRGGIPCAVIITCLFYGAISGSGSATCAAVGSMTIPILMELGYDKKFSGAMLATASGLGVIIPPSVPFIMYGMATGVSIGDMFIAGIVPGIVIALCLMTYAVYYCIRFGEDREKIDQKVNTLKKCGFLNLIKDGIWAILTPVILLGGIYSGVVTPTEVACVAVLYSIIISVFVYRTVRPSQIVGLFSSACGIMAPLALLLAVAVAFGRILTLLQVPMMVSDFIIQNFAAKATLLIVMNIIMLLIGMIMDTGPALMILAPMLLPTALKFGIDPVHLGIVMVVNMAVGFVTPPFGMTLFVASPLINETPMTIGRKAVPFIATLIVALLLITFIPMISLCLL